MEDRNLDSSEEESDGSDSEVGRLTEMLADEGVVRWFEALDFQVLGACRSDDRLNPLFNFNTQDRFIAHLSQHFEAVEVGMLARCLCIPLVSIRVGKVNKEGTMLCPTSTRGNLNLTVLPTSDLRLSFAGDDGHTERLFTLSIRPSSSTVTVDEISADSTGRSFLIKVPHGETYYFWCSEWSKLLGIELLAKMKDFLVRRPSIAELTGISESRLVSFVTYLRAYLIGSTVVGTPTSLAVSVSRQDSTSHQFETPQDGQLSSSSSKSQRPRHPGNQAARAGSSFQGSLSPRSSSFKEGPSRNLSSLKTAAREKSKRCGDTHLVVDNLTVASVSATEESSNYPESDIVSTESGESCSSTTTSSVLDYVGVTSDLSLETEVPFTGDLPYYCWCPPVASTLQFSAGTPMLPSSSIISPLLPPLSSLLPAALPSSLLAQTPPFSLVGSPIPTAQQIPTFIPLICDPIVHIPVIDICSSGQGYLVSAGPSLSTCIPPMHETESLVEKGARETLRLLISGSSQTNPTRMMDSLPSVPSMIVAGSRALYASTRDVDVIASSIAAIGLVSLSGGSDVEAIVLRCKNNTDNDELDKSHQTSDDRDSFPSTTNEEEEDQDRD